MSNLKSIYRSEAERYQALVGREDYEDHLLKAILEIGPLDGKDVLELGAGTGRGELPAGTESPQAGRGRYFPSHAGSR